MPAYRFEAVAVGGRIERGVLDADSPRAARSLLRERGFTPLEVTAVQESAPARSVVGGRMRMPELSLATRQLAALLAARLPLEQALSAVVELCPPWMAWVTESK